MSEDYIETKDSYIQRALSDLQNIIDTDHDDPLTQDQFNSLEKAIMRLRQALAFKEA